jgi:hypothetical protein
MNHNIYNNGFNVDKEGAWDGMKINSYAGLKVRVGDSNNPSNPPKTALDVTDSSTTVKDVFCINKTCITEDDLKKLKVVTFVYTIDRTLGPNGTHNLVNVPNKGVITRFLFEGDTQDQGWGNGDCNNIQFIINGQVIGFMHAKRGRQVTKYENPGAKANINANDMLSVQIDGYPGCTGIIFEGSKITMTIEV